MVSLKTRRLAVPMVLACAGVFAGATSAHAQSGGLSVTPAALEHTAKRGTVGSLTLNNTTKETLKVTVTVRPWRQELFGNVVVDARTTLSKYVRATTTAFTIGQGVKRPVTFKMLRGTGSGSLYGAVDVDRQAHQHQGPQGHHPELPPDLEDPPQRAELEEEVPPGCGRRPGPLRRRRPAGPQPRQHDRPDRRAPTRSPAPPAAPAPRRPSPPSRASSSA